MTMKSRWRDEKVPTDKQREVQNERRDLLTISMTGGMQGCKRDAAAEILHQSITEIHVIYLETQTLSKLWTP